MRVYYWSYPVGRYVIWMIKKPCLIQAIKTLRFLFTLFLINFARWAKLRVDSVSPKHLDPGWTFAIIHVFALPPRESCLKKSKEISFVCRFGATPRSPSTTMQNRGTPKWYNSPEVPTSNVYMKWMECCSFAILNNNLCSKQKKFYVTTMSYKTKNILILVTVQSSSECWHPTEKNASSSNASIFIFWSARKQSMNFQIGNRKFVKCSVSHISTQTNSGDPVIHFNQSLNITDTESFPNFNSQIIRKKAYTSLSTLTNM